MTNGMKWFALCVVAFLLFCAAVTFLPGHNDTCGHSGVRQVIPAGSHSDYPTIICNDGATVQP